jgi:hypothetical protein
MGQSRKIQIKESKFPWSSFPPGIADAEVLFSTIGFMVFGESLLLQVLKKFFYHTRGVVFIFILHPNFRFLFFGFLLLLSPVLWKQRFKILNC